MSVKRIGVVGLPDRRAVASRSELKALLTCKISTAGDFLSVVCVEQLEFIKLAVERQLHLLLSLLSM